MPAIGFACGLVAWLAISSGALSHEMLADTRPFVSEGCAVDPEDCCNLQDGCFPRGLVQSLLSEESAISLKPAYYGEVFTNARGGISTRGATQYEGLLDLRLKVDFEQLKLPLPGRFYMLTQNTHGRGLSEDFVGDIQAVSNIDSFGNIMQVSEYWWEFDLFDDRLRFQLGKQVVENTFLVTSLSDDFLNGSFSISPFGPVPSYPDGSMAAVMIVQATESTTLRFGTWDALSSGGNWGISGNNVFTSFGEFETAIALHDGQLPGRFTLGVVHTSNGRFLGFRLPGSIGWYIQHEQWLMRENAWDTDDEQGLAAFISYFPRYLLNDFPLFVPLQDSLAGLIYVGLLPERDEDVLGIGVTSAKFQPGRFVNFGGPDGAETTIELFYKAKVGPRTTVQPDFQYVINPGGVHPDAVVVGVRVQTNF